MVWISAAGKRVGGFLGARGCTVVMLVSNTVVLLVYVTKGSNLCSNAGVGHSTTNATTNHGR